MDKWNTFIEAYGELIRSPESMKPAKADSTVMKDFGQSKLGRARMARREFPPDSEIAKTIEVTDAVLNERRRPVPLDALFTEVTRRGLQVGGAKPKENYGARLYNSGRYRSFGKAAGWWFANRPPPDAAGDEKLGDASWTSESDLSSTAPGEAKTGLFAAVERLNGTVSPTALMSFEGATMI